MGKNVNCARPIVRSALIRIPVRGVWMDLRLISMAYVLLANTESSSKGVPYSANSAPTDAANAPPSTHANRANPALSGTTSTKNATSAPQPATPALIKPTSAQNVLRSMPKMDRGIVSGATGRLALIIRGRRISGSLVMSRFLGVRIARMGGLVISVRGGMICLWMGRSVRLVRMAGLLTLRSGHVVTVVWRTAVRALISAHAKSVRNRSNSKLGSANPARVVIGVMVPASAAHARRSLAQAKAAHYARMPKPARHARTPLKTLSSIAVRAMNSSTGNASHARRTHLAAKNVLEP